MVALDETPTAPGEVEAPPFGVEVGSDGVPDDPEDPEEPGAASDPPPIVAPHSPQKRSPASAGAKQDGHTTASDPPHWTQKRRPSLF
jgi:hypothetical protein